MANTNATNVKTGSVPGVKSMPQHLICNTVTAAVTTALALNDTITGPSIPAGAYLIDVILMSTDLDTAGSPTITLDVGISGAATKFIAASTIGQTGGVARLGGTTGLGYSPTSDTPVIVTVSAAGTTKAAGTVVLSIVYTNDP